MASDTIPVVFPDAELEHIFNGDSNAFIHCAGALRLEVEADAYAPNGFYVEAVHLVADAKAETGELIGSNHWLHHAVSRFYRQPGIVRAIHAELELERLGRKDAA